LSRKKNVSLVVIASTTSAVSASAPLFHLLSEFGNAWQARLAGQRYQTALDQILLVGRQIQPGAFFQKLLRRYS